MATEKSTPRGRPIINKIERIPATPKDIAKTIFRAADKKVKQSKKKKPNPN